MGPLILAPFAVFAAALVLGAAYSLALTFLPSLWGPALVNAILVALFYAVRGRLGDPKAEAAVARNQKLQKTLAQLPRPTWPLVLVVSTSMALGAWGLVLVTGSGQGVLTWDATALAAVFLVPVVEELLFRGIITPIAQRYWGVAWGIYLSALLFSFVHSVPQLLAPTGWGLALGPLLLAFCVECLRLWSRRLWPCILFHIAANGTVYIFQYMDPRWLDWLKPLYLK